jgi:seryl-tRNA synthetase
MLDINILFEDKGGNPELVRESQRRRGAPVEVVDEIIELYKTWTRGEL